MPLSFQTSCRHGKWTREEMEYSKVLMEAFSLGLLPEDDEHAVEGTSLRYYLAKKLRCNPKRVSKKFECTAYNGKQLYAKDLVFTAEQKKKVQDFGSRIASLRGGFEESILYMKAAEDAKQKDSNENGVTPVPVVSAAKAEVTKRLEPASLGQAVSSSTPSNHVAVARNSWAIPSLERKDGLYLALVAQQHQQKALQMFLQQPRACDTICPQSHTRTPSLPAAAFPSLAQNHLTPDYRGMQNNATRVRQMQALNHLFQSRGPRDSDTAESPQADYSNKRARFF